MAPSMTPTTSLPLPKMGPGPTSRRVLPPGDYTHTHTHRQTGSLRTGNSYSDHPMSKFWADFKFDLNYACQCHQQCEYDRRYSQDFFYTRHYKPSDVAFCQITWVLVMLTCYTVSMTLNAIGHADNGLVTSRYTGIYTVSQKKVAHYIYRHKFAKF